MLIAHAGHTLTTIAYFVPVVAFLVWLVVVQIKDRRGRSDGQDPAGG
jgi:cytochrome c oxidase assembly factor CtaG